MCRKFMFRSGSVGAPVGPDPLLLLSTCGRLSRKVLYESLGIVRQHPNSTKNAPTEVQIRVGMRICANFEFSPKRSLKSEFGAPITFSMACNSSRDRHHSIDQNLDYSKKIGRAKVTHKIARKSRKCVKNLRLVRVQLGRRLALTRYYS